MKVISLLAQSEDSGINKSVGAIYDIFSELGIDVLEINLALPLFCGSLCTEFLDIMDKIQDYNGILIACASNLFGPCPEVYNFLAYFERYKQKNIFLNKNCLILAVSESGGEKNTLDFLSRYINYFEGYDSVKIGLNQYTINELDESNELKDIFEKQIEDFYRLIRQNRKFFIPREASYSNVRSNVQVFDHIAALDKTGGGLSIDELLQKYDNSNDPVVCEIAKFYESKLSSIPEKKQVDKFYLDEFSDDGEVAVRLKNYKQKTKNLPHYFKGGLNITFSVQLIINSADNNNLFECYLKITNSACEYFDGKLDSPDIVIYAKDTAWDDIISGKRTAQKSFMTGQLKVKGNFVLLTKFDQLFDSVL